MQVNTINENQIGRKQNVLILAVFPLSIFICGILIWIFRADYNISSVLSGLKEILSSPTTLYTDFLELGDISSSLINSSLIGFFNLYLLNKYEMRINGAIIAAFMTVIGFSFFGKNVFNVLPIYLGGYLYSKYQKKEFKDVLVSIMFGTALAPVVSQISFYGFYTLHISVPIGVLIGVFIGFVLVPLATSMLRFHEGYNLYNIGFTSGILGTVLTSIIRSANFEVEASNILYTEKNLILLGLFSFHFIFLIVIGLIINKRAILSYKNILKYKGRAVTDFPFLVGYGVTFLNMGVLGLLSLSIAYLAGGIINGPIIAAIFTVSGFAAFGKHIKNCFPVALGVILSGLIFKSDFSSTSFIITVLFSTTLAPIAGGFGFFPGIIAGMLHFTLATNIGIIHGGLNLYNNGFAGGLVAGFLVPVLDSFKRGEK